MKLIVSEMGKEFDKDFQTKRYQNALNKYIEKIKKDNHVLAVLLSGSFAYDQVWHRSDLDIMIVHDDEKQKRIEHQCHYEDDVIINVEVYFREIFLKSAQRSLQGGPFHHELHTTKLVYCTDETIEEYIEQFREIGSKDIEYALMHAFSRATYALEKCGKMMYVKKNIAYATYYLTIIITELARIEVFKSNQVPQREVILQAIELNPKFFKSHYLDIIINEITLKKLEKNLEELETYMDSIIEDIFQPVLKFLKDEGQPIGYSELFQKFTLKRREGWFNFNFLADKGIIERTLAPIHISGKSRATVYEPAFYYE